VRKFAAPTIYRRAFGQRWAGKVMPTVLIPLAGQGIATDSTANRSHLISTCVLTLARFAHLRKTFMKRIVLALLAGVVALWPRSLPSHPLRERQPSDKLLDRIVEREQAFIGRHEETLPSGGNLYSGEPGYGIGRCPSQ